MKLLRCASFALIFHSIFSPDYRLLGAKTLLAPRTLEAAFQDPKPRARREDRGVSRAGRLPPTAPILFGGLG